MSVLLDDEVSETAVAEVEPDGVDTTEEVGSVVEGSGLNSGDESCSTGTLEVAVASTDADSDPGIAVTADVRIPLAAGGGKGLVLRLCR